MPEITKAIRVYRLRSAPKLAATRRSCRIASSARPAFVDVSRQST